MRYSTALKYLKHLLKERVTNKLRWCVVMEGLSTSLMSSRGTVKNLGCNPNYFWAEAVTCAVYLINRSPTQSVPNTTPIEAWSGFKPMCNT